MALPAYIPTQWVNGTAPAINAVNLNHLEQGIKEVTDVAIENEAKLAVIVPIGLISLYSGATIPAGWALCDGSQGTPDLRGKFILGGTGSNNGATGGSADAVAVSHSHTFTGNALAPHDHSVNFSYGGQFTADAGIYPLGTSATTDTVTGGKSAGTPSGTVNASGVSGAGKNMPPYYTLAYIMKIA